MKSFHLLLLPMLVLFISCGKEVFEPGTNTPAPTQKPEGNQQSVTTASNIYNPIVGKWELGVFKILCAGGKDTTIYPNERGDFVEFQKTDTAYYIFNTTNATGWSPYKILDSSRFILGDTMLIIAYNGVQLTTYTRSLNGGSQQWMTYKKITN